ncbi:MAG TPA: hypothetical protein VKV69_06110 [Actinomycetota bacterium]|nr:hypothetical protein [Actinomycetota bacterium]
MQRRIRLDLICYSVIACGVLFGAAVLVPASSSAATAPKVFSAALTSFGGNPTELEITITNDSTGAAVLGSATITAPTTVTLSGTPTIVGTSAAKAWNASRSGRVIKLGAVSDLDKLMPGQYVTVDFLATVPSVAGNYVFAVAGKPSLGFTGSATYTQLGPSPTLTVCSDTSCTASNGDTNNPPPNREVGSFTLDGGCSGCTISISNTVGDFCNDPTPPGQCKAPVVPQFEVDPGYNGFVHFTLACDKTNCPVLAGPSPSPTLTAPINSAGADTYPVYYTDSDAPTNSEQFVQILPSCADTEGTAPCVESENRISEGPGAGDLQTTILLFFSGSSDPRVAH